MRIVAIDASRRNGVISRSVEAAAASAEATGAHVTRVRLRDLEIKACTSCSMCKVYGSCKIDDDIPGLAALVSESDGVIIGTQGYFSRPDEATRALLDRLSSYFSPDSRQLHLPGLGHKDVPRTPRARAARRAVIITACSAPEPLATFFGYSTGPIRQLRGALKEGGIQTIGSLAVTDTWRHPELHEWERDKATSLGRVLAGKI